MTATIDANALRVWAKRVQAYDTDAEFRAILNELASDKAFAKSLLHALAGFPDPIVRAWAGTAAAKVLGEDAVPILNRLRGDRDADVRDIAREDLIAIDPAFEQTLLPDYRHALRRRKDPWGADSAAMYAVARARDREAIPLLREYAAGFQERYWHNRMPLVLVDYIEDPSAITRRIREHDHAFMYWLIQAAETLGIPDTRDAMKDALARSMDDTCAAIIRERLERAQRVTLPNAD